MRIFVGSYVRKWGIPLQVISVDVKGFAEQYQVSIETAARECRYSAFEECECHYVATAHTASDNLETILFRLARGTALQGLCGIPSVRDKYLRPLLQVTRNEIEAFLQSKQRLKMLMQSAINQKAIPSNLCNNITLQFKDE